MIDMVIGTQFGDEGKGRLVDFLCSIGGYDLCAKVNGSDNAGHSVTLRSGERIAFQQVPIGVIHGIPGIIARGCIVDLMKLDEEIGRLENMGFSDLQIILDPRCHVKTPEHRMRDKKEEEDRSRPIGTTLSGNGPAYSDKHARRNARVADFDLMEYGVRDPSYPNIARRVAICDTSLMASSGRVLVEGSHGVMLDIDHGTYPFVSSSGCTSAFALHSLGASPPKSGRVIGAFKPYITRVGSGAFPTEINSKHIQSVIRDRGHEYGTVTGRSRRIGWLDLPALFYAIRVAGVTELALMKVDVLDEIETISIGRSYSRITPGTIPALDSEYSEVRVIYSSFSWSRKGLAKLVDIVEAFTYTPITMISSGLKEEDIIIR